jgi:putative ABC transport system permease protein
MTQRTTGRARGAVREAVLRIWGLLTRRGRPTDANLDDELRFHSEMLEADLRRQGLDRETARREASLRLGGRAQIAEAYADQRSLPWVETLLQDARYGARTLRRAPGFTAVALLTLALGIGANTAIFSVVHATLLSPLPFAAPDRLVVFGDRQADGLPSNMDFTTWNDYRVRNRSLDQTAMIRSWQPTLVVNDEAERINAVRVSWNYFEMLGARPARGRTFLPEDDRQDRWRVLVLSDGLWRRRFGADPSVLGRTIRMNDRDYQIVGVMGPEFEELISQDYYRRAEMWAALGYDTTMRDACRGCRHLRALGRLREGVTLDRAAADLNAIRTQLVAEHPAEYPRNESLTVMRLQEKIAGPVRGTLLTLLAAVGFVLLIACANVANLLLARSANRSREIAVRAALGAGRGRIVRQLLTESMLLGVAGGALGVVLAAFSVQALESIAPVSIPRIDQVAVSGWVLGFALVVSLTTGLLFGLVPARRAAVTDLQATLAADTRTAAGGGQTARRVLIVADLALALVLLAGAGLMLKSVGRLLRVDPGFDPTNVLTLQFSLVGQAYAEDPVVLQVLERVVDRVASLPGVESAAIVGQVPLGGNHDTWGFHIEGRIPQNPAESPSVERYSVTPDYFRVMRVPLRSGRLFTVEDKTSSMPVIIISESTADTLFKGEDPIGRRILLGDVTQARPRTIVGVVGNVRHYRLDTPATMQMYLPQSQTTDSFVVLVARTAGQQASRLTPAVRAIVREIDPAIPIYDVVMLGDLVDQSVEQRRFAMRLLGGFAGLALLLAAVGLYGVVSYTVTQRARELAVRVALGATGRDIVRLVLESGAATLAAGLAIGLLAALVAVRLMETLLFEVSPSDPATFAGAAAALTFVALLAHLIPIRRALRIDPVIALRQG